ncbi:hypothetical protein D3C73_1204590 [compost metagenome]
MAPVFLASWLLKYCLKRASLGRLLASNVVEPSGVVPEPPEIAANSRAPLKIIERVERLIEMTALPLSSAKLPPMVRE